MPCWRHCLAAALLVLPGAAAGTSVETLRDYLDSLDTFAAAFTQQRFDEDGELLETAHGTCLIKRPGRFRWTYLEPYAQLILSDGETLWIYDEDLEQVTVSALDERRDDSPAALLAREIDIAAHYRITHLERADDSDWFRLEPREPAREFSAVELALADGEVRAMRLYDNLGQVTALRFSDIVRNQPVDDARFSFTPPPGVDVVRGAMP